MVDLNFIIIFFTYNVKILAAVGGCKHPPTADPSGCSGSPLHFS
jgi:hypothetical protein